MDHPIIKYLPSFIRKQIEGRNILQKTISNTGWLFADKIICLGVGLFVSIWLARYLGPEKFGVYSYAIAFVALFSAFATLGLDDIIVRDIVHNPSEKEKTLGTGFFLKLFGGIMTFLLIASAISFVGSNDNLKRLFVIIITVGIIFKAFDVIDFWFQSQIKSKYTVYAKNTAFLLASITIVYLVISGEVVIGAVGLVISYQVTGSIIREWRVSFRRTKELLHDSWPLILSSIVIMIYMRIDQVMIGEMLGDSEVGIYSVAVRLSEAWYFIPIAITMSVFPSIIDARKISKSLYNERLQKLYNLMTWIAIAIAIPITFLSHDIIRIVYGANYIKASPVLSIYVWAGIFVFLGVASGKFLLAENYTRIAFYRTLFGAVINVVLNIIFIPKYGIKGAAVTTLVSYFAATFFIVFMKNTRQQSVMMVKSLLLIPGIKRGSHV
jgi:PST family polysaccharide transporter